MRLISKFNATAAAIAVILTCSAPVWAIDTMEITLKKTQDPIPHKFVDVLGLYPGQSLTEAQAVLKKIAKSNPDTMKATYTPRIKGVFVKSSFTAAMEFLVGDNDTINIYLGSPATDSQIVGIYRNVNFKDPFSAPTSDQMAKSLIEKYGTPSLDHPAKGIREITWFFTGPNATRPCKLGSCMYRIAPKEDGYDQGRSVLKQGLIVGVKVILFLTSEQRVQNMQIEVDDYQNRVTAYDTMDKYWNDEISKGMSKGQAVQPKL